MKTTKATAKMNYNASDYSELWRFDCIDCRLLATRSDEDYNKSVNCAVVEDLYYRKRQRKKYRPSPVPRNKKPNRNSRVR